MTLLAPGLAAEQRHALIMVALNAAVVLAWEWLHLPAFMHSFGLWWTWYCCELALAAIFYGFSYRWVIESDLHRRQSTLACWVVLMLVVGWRVAVLSGLMVRLLDPIAPHPSQ